MTVFGLVSAVAGFVKVRFLVDKAVIDNIVFRAHYRITSAIMFLCCIIVTANNLIGKRYYRIQYLSLFDIFLPAFLAPTQRSPRISQE